MRQRLRLIVTVAVTGIGVGGLSACGLAPESRFEDGATVQQRVTSVRLDSESGGIVIRGQEGGTGTSVHRKVSYRGDKPTGHTYHVEDGVLVLNGCGRYCSVNYSVTVPAGIPVSGKTSSGAIELSRLGNVEVSTDSGAITLKRISGDVDVETSNGEIRGRSLRGSHIQAQTSNGEIVLAPGRPRDVRAETSNGDITLTMPEASYRVQVETSNGDKDIRIGNDPDGEYRLDLRTSNGDVTVKPA